MSRYRKVHTKMWTSEDFRALSAPPPCGQALWIHMLTGQQTTAIPGLMATGIARLSEQLRWSFEGTRAALGEILAQDMALFDEAAGLLYIPRAFDHDRPANPNVIKHWREAWNDLPPCPLKARAWRDLHAHLKAMGEPHAAAFAEACKRPKATPLPEAEPNNNGYGNGSTNGLANGSPNGFGNGLAKGSAAGSSGDPNGSENLEGVSKTDTSEVPKTPGNMAFPGSDPNNNGYGNGLAKQEQEQEQEAGTGSQTTSASGVRVDAPAYVHTRGALAPGPGRQPPREDQLLPFAAGLLAHLRQAKCLGPVATPQFAETLSGRTALTFKLPWVLACIDEADRKVDVEQALGRAFAPEELALLVAKFCDRAKAPRDPPPLRALPGSGPRGQPKQPASTHWRTASPDDLDPVDLDQKATRP